MKKTAPEWKRAALPPEATARAENTPNPSPLTLLPGGSDPLSARSDEIPDAGISPHDADALRQFQQFQNFQRFQQMQAAGGTSTAASIPRETLEVIHRDWFFEARYSKKRRSPRTLESYGATVRVLFDWMDETGRDAIDEASLKSFFEALAIYYAENADTLPCLSKTQPGARMQESHWNNLRVMFNFAVRQRKIIGSPLGFVPKPYYEPAAIEPFTIEEVTRLLRATYGAPCGLRDYAILLFMFDSGLRASETCNLKISDVNFETREVTVRHGKGNKKRVVIICPAVLTAIWEYLKTAKYQDEGAPLFQSMRGGTPSCALTRWGLLQMYHTYGTRAGIDAKRCSPHTMRHSFGSEYVMDGGVIDDLMRLMGHTKREMTDKYISLSNEHLRAQHARHSPAERLLAGKRVIGPKRRR